MSWLEFMNLHPDTERRRDVFKAKQVRDGCAIVSEGCIRATENILQNPNLTTPYECIVRECRPVEWLLSRAILDIGALTLYSYRQSQVQTFLVVFQLLSLMAGMKVELRRQPYRKGFVAQHHCLGHSRRRVG